MTVAYYRKHLLFEVTTPNNLDCRSLASTHSSKEREGSDLFLCKLAEFQSPSAALSRRHSQPMRRLTGILSSIFANEEGERVKIQLRTRSSFLCILQKTCNFLAPNLPFCHLIRTEKLKPVCKTTAHAAAEDLTNCIDPFDGSYCW